MYVGMFVCMYLCIYASLSTSLAWSLGLFWIGAHLAPIQTGNSYVGQALLALSVREVMDLGSGGFTLRLPCLGCEVRGEQGNHLGCFYVGSIRGPPARSSLCAYLRALKLSTCAGT